MYLSFIMRHDYAWWVKILEKNVRKENLHKAGERASSSYLFNNRCAFSPSRLFALVIILTPYFHLFMLELNPSFVISSRLSTLDSKDILRIIHLAEKRWNEKQIKARMSQHGETPVIGVGISNPQELSRVMYDDIPVIHIQSDCKSLQAVQRKYIRNLKIWHRVLMIGTSSLWGMFGYGLTQFGFKRGNDTTQIRIFENGNIPVPNYILGASTLTFTFVLSWITKKLFCNIRDEYQIQMQDGECILYRNDIIYSKFKYFIRIVVPYWFIGLSVFHLKSKKRAV